MSQDNQEPEVPEIFKGFVTEAVNDGEITHQNGVVDKNDGPDWPQFTDVEQLNAEADNEEEDEDDVEDVSEENDGADDDDGVDVDDDEDTDDDEERETSRRRSRKKGAAARISELTKARRSAEERASELEARLEALERGEKPKAEKPAEVEIDTSDLKAPNPADYDFGEIDAKYMEEMAEYKAEIAFRKREAKAEAKRAEESALKAKEEAAAQLEQNFLDNVYEPGKTLFNDFEEVVIEGGKAGEYRLTPTLVSLISESESGAKIMYHFASNPDEASKVANMPVERQAAYFGRLEARFASSEEDAGKSRRAKPSRAPKPPIRQSRGSGAGKKTNPATTDFRSFENMVRAKG